MLEASRRLHQILALIAKLRRVVQHKDEIFSGGDTITCRLEMAG
jgi:hypothetical protein